MNNERTNEVLRALKILCDFAYEQGFHEMGYDPVEEISSIINELEFNSIPRAAVQAAVDEINRLCDAVGYRCDEFSGGKCSGYIDALAELRDTCGVTPTEG